MMTKHVRTVGLLALAALSVSVFAGCPWSPDKITTKPPIETKYKPQTSLQNVLANLEVAYQDKDYPEYEKLFASNYIFVFNPADVADDDNPTPSQWARAEELDSAKKLFESDTVDDISLNWSIGDPTSAEDEYPASPGCLVSRVDEVNLDVVTRRDDTIWIYKVQGATHFFYCKPDTTQIETSSGPMDKWEIFVWKDSPIGDGKAVAAK